MRWWKRIALNSYWYGSLPFRNRLLRQWAASGRVPVVILFYHRIADDHPNAWTLTTRQFKRQIDWLRRHTQLVSLEEAQCRIAGGHNKVPTTCITFDDGYADNGRFALPLLLRHHIPVTYFVSLQHVSSGIAFPHDREAGVPLATNTLAQLRQWAAAGVEIGHHTRGHTDLGTVVDEADLYDELVESGRELSRSIRRPVRYFAFPYGQHANLHVRAFQMAREAGYRAVCSAFGGYNLPGDDAFHLRRIHADPEWARFRNWVTLDPRQLVRTRRCQRSMPAWKQAESDQVSTVRRSPASTPVVSARPEPDAVGGEVSCPSPLQS